MDHLTKQNIRKAISLLREELYVIILRNLVYRRKTTIGIAEKLRVHKHLGEVESYRIRSLANSAVRIDLLIARTNLSITLKYEVTPNENQPISTYYNEKIVQTKKRT